MKHSIKAGAVILTILAFTAGPIVAFAEEGSQDPVYTQCTPHDAYDEKVIDVPGQEAIPGTEGIPAVDEVAEVSHTEYQRYSWKGGPLSGNPESTPPSDDWQANTSNRGGSHDDDPVGVAFQADKNGNGKADWFFWTATVVIDQEYVPGKDAIPAVPGTDAIAEVSHTVHHNAVVCDESIEFCTQTGSHPVATNLAADGWNIKPNRGEFVYGGLHLYSTSDSSGWAQKILDVPFSQIGNLATSGTQTDQYTFGVILTLNDWDQQIHYDADGRYWTDIPGIFPESTLNGGYYETHNLQDDLLDDVNIHSIVLYVNAGHGEITINSQEYQCGSQDFTFIRPNQPFGETGTYTRDLWPVCVDPFDGTATTAHQELTWTREYVWNDSELKWELGPQVDGDWITVSENLAPWEGCPIPDKVEYTPWVDGEFGCGDTTVQTVRQVEVTPYIWNNEDGWILGETVSAVQTSERVLTDEEKTVCPVVTPPPPPVKEEPTEPSGLAATGGSDLTGFGILGAILLAIGATIVVAHRIKAKN